MGPLVRRDTAYVLTSVSLTVTIYLGWVNSTECILVILHATTLCNVQLAHAYADVLAYLLSHITSHAFHGSLALVCQSMLSIIGLKNISMQFMIQIFILQYLTMTYFCHCCNQNYNIYWHAMRCILELL